MLFESGLGLVKKHKQIKSKGMEKDILSNIKQKKVGVATLISDKTDFRVRKIIWNKDGHYKVNQRGLQSFKQIHRYGTLLHICSYIIYTSMVKQVIMK